MQDILTSVLAPVIGVVTVIGAIAVAAVRVRFASVLAKRLESRPPVGASPDPAIGELHEELDAMQERLDFLERALLAQKNQSDRALP